MQTREKVAEVNPTETRRVAQEEKQQHRKPPRGSCRCHIMQGGPVGGRGGGRKASADDGRDEKERMAPGLSVECFINRNGNSGTRSRFERRNVEIRLDGSFLWKRNTRNNVISNFNTEFLG